MTAEEQQDAALEVLLAAKSKQKADRANATKLRADLAAKQAETDTAYATYQQLELQRRQIQSDYFNAQNHAEGDDVVSIARASQAYAEAMQNHGFIAT